MLPLKKRCESVLVNYLKKNSAMFSTTSKGPPTQRFRRDNAPDILLKCTKAADKGNSKVVLEQYVWKYLLIRIFLWKIWKQILKYLTRLRLRYSRHAWIPRRTNYLKCLENSRKKNTKTIFWRSNWTTDTILYKKLECACLSSPQMMTRHILFLRQFRFCTPITITVTTDRS